MKRNIFHRFFEARLKASTKSHTDILIYLTRDLQNYYRDTLANL